jgi:23S rRNA pseudouridine1911/1915/1917 synthase
VFLAAELPSESRSSIHRAVEEGRVKVDDIYRKVSYKLQGGEIIQFLPVSNRSPSEILPAPYITISVLFEDEHLLVVDKPAGIATHPSPTSRDATLVNALLAHTSELSLESGAFRPGIVHRLDKGTSGLLLVAKTDPVHRALQQAIQLKQVQRRYLAWSQGVPKQEQFTIQSYLGRHPKDRKRQAVVTSSTADARLAITHCSLLATGGGVSQIECTLETGRTHQIRVHLASVGLPILGDPTYGVKFSGLTRPALHAYAIAFTHPVTHASLKFKAPIPEDLLSVELPRAGEIPEDL